MTAWTDISTAPKDGSRVHVKRVYDGRVVYDGLAEWRRFTSGPLIDPFTGKQYAGPVDEMAWMHPAGSRDQAFKVPTPTHWRA